MSPKRALQLILAVSLFGVAFSGHLSYRELTGDTVLTCPSPGAAGTIFGYPACVYGLLMYSLIAGLAVWGMLSLRGARNLASVSSQPESLGLLGPRP